MFTKIGHRGAMGYAPENTLLSFKKAIELNVDMIELDVHLCKTGELVVIHDNKINRTTNRKGLVAKKTFNELRSLDAGQGEKIPTLEEVFNLVQKKVQINIELKGRETARPVYELIEDYIQTKNWNYSDFLISSSDYCELKKFNDLNPIIKIGVIVPKASIDWIKFTEKLNIFSVHPNIKLVNQTFIDNAHRKGLKVFVWTVNNPNDIQRMKSFGVDGIFSNFPDRL